MMNDGDDSTSYLYAWLARDPQGIEGIVTVATDHGILPLVCTDRSMAQGMATAAGYAAEQRDNPVRLVRFERGITLTVAQPPGPSARP